MGLFNEVKSLITVKADTSQARQEIRELSGVERAAAKERLASLEAGNKKLESSIATFGKAAGALGAVAIAGKVAFDAIEFSGRRADLTAAAGTVSIERLRKATLGLRTDTQLLELAGKLNHSAMKLNAEQMDIAGRAATALAERGGDAQEAFDAVTAALVSGKTKGLAPFGIQIDETKDKAEKFSAIMKELAKVQGEVSESTLDASDKVGQQKVKLANVFDTVQNGIGKVASEMLPFLELLGDIGSLVGGLVGGVDSALSGIGRIAKYGIPVYGQVLLVRDAVSGNVFDMAKQYAGQRATNEANARLGGSAGQLGAGVNVMFRPQSDTEMPGMYVGRIPKSKRGGQDADSLAREQADSDSEQAEIWAQTQNDGYIRRMVGGMDRGQVAGRGADGFTLPSGAAGIDWDSAKSNIEQAGLLANEALNSIQGPTILERMFGEKSELDGYTEAWGALTSVASSGYNAMIDGTMSLGSAVKKAAADAIKSIGLKMLIEGLEQTATGIKMAAGVYTAPLAPGHFAAAAKFFAGAAIAGAAASALGGGGGAPSGGAGRSPGAPASYGSPISGGYQGGQNVTIVYGDQFADDSPRNRQRTAQKLVGKALGTSGVTYS